MIVMDRENALAPGWSHVLSTSNDLEEPMHFAAGWVRRGRRSTCVAAGRISTSRTRRARWRCASRT